jgi:hypothetical protein
MEVTVEDQFTFFNVNNNEKKLMIDKFDDGSHLTIFFTGGYSSVALTREETEALIQALQLALEAA